VVAAEIDDLAIEVEVDGLRRRLAGKLRTIASGAGMLCCHAFFSSPRKSEAGADRTWRSERRADVLPGHERRTARRKKARWDS